jgi:hypothetical protein
MVRVEFASTRNVMRTRTAGKLALHGLQPGIDAAAEQQQLLPRLTVIGEQRISSGTEPRPRLNGGFCKSVPLSSCGLAANLPGGANHRIVKKLPHRT